MQGCLHQLPVVVVLWNFLAATHLLSMAQVAEYPCLVAKAKAVVQVETPASQAVAVHNPAVGHSRFHQLMAVPLARLVPCSCPLALPQ
jgi:hypothetical protein